MHPSTPEVWRKIQHMFMCMFMLYVYEAVYVGMRRVSHGFHLFPLIPPTVFNGLFNAVAHERLFQRNVTAGKMPASVH